MCLQASEASVMSPISTTGETPMSVEGDVSTKKLEDLTAEEMTSKDYYFDSYAHFGIHEVSKLTPHSLNPPQNVVQLGF